MDVRNRVLKSESDLALTSFVAARHPTESCGHNGLPLTPNSISILGQAQTLKGVSAHDRLCAMLDCIRAKHERVVVVSEFYKKNLKEREIKDEEKEACLKGVAGQILQALSHLHAHNMSHATLDSANVLFDDQDDVKLFNFGLGHMTAYGEYVAFPIFNPRYAAPEVIASGIPVAQIFDPNSDNNSDNSNNSPRSSDQQLDSLTQIPDAPSNRYDPKCDIWSLGMILATKALDLQSPWQNLKIPQILRKVLSFSEYQSNVFDRIARENEKTEVAKNLPANLRKLIDLCLEPDLTKRPTAKDLLNSEIFNQITEPTFYYSVFPTMRLRCNDLKWPPEEDNDDEEEEDPLDVLTIEETYYLWKLAGGDIMGELRKHGLMVTRPPIIAVPKMVLGEGHTEGEKKEKCTLYDPVVIPLSLKQLRNCVKELTVEDCYPLLHMNEDDEDDGKVDETAQLPLVIKEGDVKYQFKRVILYRQFRNFYFLKNTL